MLGCFDCITVGWDESVGLIVEAGVGWGGGVGLFYERDSPGVSRVWYICISESSLVQSCTSTLCLLPYFLVMIPTLRIRIYVVLLLMFIINYIFRYHSSDRCC